MVANPILEEVMPGEETQEISDEILDQNSSGEDAGLENVVSADAVSEARTDSLAYEESTPEGAALNGTAETATGVDGDDDSHVDAADSFDEIDYGREFQDYLD